MRPATRCIAKACFVSICFLFLTASPALAQTDASALISEVFNAFSRGTYVRSVQLTGSATWYAGTEEDSGSITLTADADGAASMSLQMSRWSRLEQQTAFGDDRICTWTATDNVSHPLQNSSCWIAVNWVLPQAYFQPGHIPSDIGVETFSVESGLLGLRSQAIVGPIGTSAAVTTAIQQASAADLTLDALTARPVTLSFNLPSSNGSSAPVRTEIRYSNYKQMAGLMLATHIERYINGSLQMTIDLTQVTPQS